jgi:DNA segregation ATPase FtsK/SpoIIIE, S-DNA-T family
MGKRLALLIATSRYLDPKLLPLMSVVDEAQQLSQLLLDPLVGDFAAAPVLIDSTKSVIEHRLEDLLRGREADDEVLLYLSGHGIKNDHDQLFFAAHDTQRKYPYSTGVPAHVVQRLLDECEARSKVVLLDCCFSGAFTKRPTEMSASLVDVDHQLGRGTYVITATNELEFAWEDERQLFGESQRYSAFTDAVLKGLTTGAAAQPGATTISAEDLYLYVHSEVAGTGLKQTPTRSNKSEGVFRIANVRSRRMITDDTMISPTVAELLPPAEEQPPTGLVTPIGQAHKDRSHGDDVLRIDLAGQEGHLAIVGRIYSGKSTLVHTLMTGLSSGRSADDVCFYCLDSGGRFGALHGFPHLKAVIAPSQPGEVRKLLAWLASLVAARDKLFRAAGITSVTHYRHVRNLGLLPDGDHGDVFLVIDGWEQFTEHVPELERLVLSVASTGLGFGVHLIATARHWRDVPPRILQLLRGRIELVLDDPAESKISPELAATLPESPGWGLYGTRRFLSAVPRADNGADDIDALVARLRDPSFVLGLDDEPQEVAPARAPGPQEFLAALGIAGGPKSFDVRQAWQPRSRADHLRVPFGIGEDGQPVVLDFKESAQDGMGPHGLLIGATGSGKSELMRTLVLGLMATHSSESLNLVMVDFKGGATFSGLENAPHVAARITNLADDVHLVDRMAEALAGELVRRQEFLARVNSVSLRDHNAARRNDQSLPSLPTLLICVDEFSELLSAKPDFIDVFVQIGRVGRSLGVHLLLASQRLEEGRLRGLDTYLSYRIALRTFSASESRAVIGLPDAYELPSVPGSGYLSVHAANLTRFTAFYVSGEDPELGTSLFDTLIDRVVGQGPPAHEVWLPPLGESPTIDALLPPLDVTEDRGLTAPAFGFNGRLTVPVGVVDRPFEQRRDLLLADFHGAAGHGVVVGGPQSGKSTLLRSIMAATALTHTPEEVQFYCVDLGGGALAVMEELPHVGGVAGRLDVDKVRRTVAELDTLLAEREQRWRDQGIGSVDEFRELKRAGKIADDDYGDVFLVIDGWHLFREDFEALEAPLRGLASPGLSYGIHVILTANRWAEIRPAMKDLLGTRFELRLGDPSESEIDRRVQVTVPVNQPGRGLTSDRRHMLTARPRIDGEAEGTSVTGGVRDLVSRVAAGWSGVHAPKVRLLPDRVDLHELRSAPGRPVPVGVDEAKLATVHFDFDAEPHFVALADGESGKTNLLRTIVRGISTRYTAKEALIVMADFRRTMLGFIDTDHLLAYAVSSGQLTDMIKDVRDSLNRRLPGPNVTQQQLRDRSWWTGPEVFVIVDDYDLVAPSGAQNPLQPLAEFIPQARDVGLHVVLARRMGGVSRALYDPVLGKLKETAVPMFIGSGSRDEGSIVGNVKPSPQPPGRGTLVTRKHGQQRIQFAWTEPSD